MSPGCPDRSMEIFEKRGEPASVVDGAIFKLGGCRPAAEASEWYAGICRAFTRKAFERDGGADVPGPPSAFEALVMSGEGFDDIVHQSGVSSVSCAPHECRPREVRATGPQR